MKPHKILFEDEGDMADFWGSKPISERFELKQELGRGGAGTVYLVNDRSLKKLCAIKVLKSDMSETDLLRFQQEAKAAGKLRHKNIVSVIDFGVTDGNVPYLVMEFLSGQDLSALIESAGTLSLDRVLDVFSQICDGMIHSHEQGVLHRDLKPANIILASGPGGEEVKILDFSLAQLKTQDLRLTKSGSFVGSPKYVSIEQAEGKSVDERSDIYSIGCMMYHALTGSPPFFGSTVVETLMLHKSAPLEPMSKRTGKEFPDDIEELVAKCLQKNPADRFRSVADLKRAIERVGERSCRPAEPLFEEEEVVEAASAEIEKKQTQVLKIAMIVTLMAGALMGVFLLLNQYMESQLRQEREKPQAALVTETLRELTGKIGTRQTAEGLEVNIQNGSLFSDKDMKKLEMYGQIRLLNLNSTNVKGPGLKYLKDSRVKEISLDGTKIDEQGLALLSQIKGLQLLSVRQIELTEKGMAEIAKLDQLRRLWVGGGSFSESYLKQLTQSKIQMLQVSNTHLSREGLKTILGIKTLKGLDLYRCSFDPSILSLVDARKELDLFCLSRSSLSAELLDAFVRVPAKDLQLVNVEMSLSTLNKLRGFKRPLSIKACVPNITDAEANDFLRTLPQNVPDRRLISPDRAYIEQTVDMSQTSLMEM